MASAMLLTCIEVGLTFYFPIMPIFQVRVWAKDENVKQYL
jgi:hypothetical protein